MSFLGCWCLVGYCPSAWQGLGTGHFGADVVLTSQAYVSHLTFCRRSHAPRYRDTFQMYMSKLQIPFSYTAIQSNNSSTHKYLLKEPSQGGKKKGIIRSHHSESSQRHSITKPNHPKFLCSIRSNPQRCHVYCKDESRILTQLTYTPY